MHEPPRESRLRRAAPALAAFGVAAVLVTAHVAAYEMVSPFDEGVHFDYVVKVLEGDVVTKGERLGQVAMREIACRGVDLEGLVPPPCEAGRTYKAAAFPNEGYNSADIHPPVYYGITAVIGRALVALGLAPDLFAAGRLVGILWLALGLLATWYLGRELRIPTLPLAVALALVASTPTLLHSSSTITNDSVALLAGAAVVLTMLRWESGRGSLWLMSVAAVLAIAIKATNIVIIGVAALYLLLRRPGPEEPSVGKSKTGLLVLVGSGLATLAVWVVVHAATSAPVVTPLDRALQGGGLRLMDVLAHLTSLVSPVGFGLPTELLGGDAFWAIGAVTGAMMMGATIGTLLRGSSGDRPDSLAVAAAITTLLGGTVFGIASFAFFGKVIVSPRYGLVLIAVLVVVLASAMRSRAVVWSLAAFAGGQFLLVMGTLLAA